MRIEGPLLMPPYGDVSDNQIAMLSVYLNLRAKKAEDGEKSFIKNKSFRGECLLWISMKQVATVALWTMSRTLGWHVIPVSLSMVLLKSYRVERAENQLVALGLEPTTRRKQTSIRVRDLDHLATTAIIKGKIAHCAAVAYWIARWTSNTKVVGPNPTWDGLISENVTYE
ncbi:hypothetical protein TNCV_1968251 [Trichonephila clavipes]|nr:hypothetical protein TNCV_1968251 [Trichonephila clavipes]